MPNVDYEAHNFVCYTVPECSSDGNTDCNYNETPSDSTSTESSIDNNVLRKQKLYRKNHKKILVPRITPGLHPQFGYFVSLTSNAVIEPQLLRMRYRLVILISEYKGVWNLLFLFFTEEMSLVSQAKLNKICVQEVAHRQRTNYSYLILFLSLEEIYIIKNSY